MKLCSSTCVLLFALLLLLPWTGETRAAAGLPLLVLEEEAHDFGTVREGSRISHDFRVVNQGTAPLEIRKVTPG